MVRYIFVPIILPELSQKNVSNTFLQKSRFLRFFRFFDCHYSESSQTWMKNNGLTFVPPNAPQILPMEAFWAILKMKVYEGNWSAKNRDHLIRRIKKSIQEIDMEIIIKMFKNLKDKIHYAKEHGLESLI